MLMSRLSFSNARQQRFTSAPLSVEGDDPLPQRSIQRLTRLGTLSVPARHLKPPGLSIAAGRIAPTVRQAASHEVSFVPFSVLG
jgi:hypothetical protein